MKILELQDFHVNPKWINESRESIIRVCEVAREQQVDIITIAGDFFDRPVLASDKGSWSTILDMARELQSVAQVCYITGTPGHDAPGAYESFKDIGWKEINIGKSEFIGDTLIMGIPEITPSMLIARFPELNKQEVIAKQYDLINQVIDTYYAPLSKQHNGHVHFMSHGHVAGAKFRDDQKPRTSDFMYSKEMLNRIGANRIQFGHIHLEQEFYGGSAHIGWGDLGFKPGFNISSSDGTVERFDFNQPARAKIIVKDIEKLGEVNEKVLSGGYEGINLWIDIKCDKEFADQFDKKESLENLKEKAGLGSLSKITTDIQHIEHIRVDTEEYEQCHTTEDIYKIYDPEATESVLLKVKEAEQETVSEVGSIDRHQFEFLDLYLRGSKAGLENGVEEIRLDWKEFQTGANLLVGENGTGKSFSLGFCTPFSEHMPTGTDLKSLFELKDSQIVRRWRDGDNIITQKILIDPTLATPSAKYYMNINGDNDLGCTGIKKNFDSAVLDLFGTPKMFMTCVFRGQKSNKDYPALEEAKETDLRQIFTELSGLDRTPLKNYSREMHKSLTRDIEMDSRDKENLEGLLEVKPALNLEIKNNDRYLKHNNIFLESKNKDLLDYQETIKSLNTLKTENEGFNNEISRLKSSSVTTEGELFNIKNELTGLNSTLENSDKYKKDLKILEDYQTQHTDASKKYFDAQRVFNKSVSDWNDDKKVIDEKLQEIADNANNIKSEISSYENVITNCESIISENKKTILLLDKPCEHCNKNSTFNQTEIEKLNNSMMQKVKTIENNRAMSKDSSIEVETLKKDYVDLRETIPVEPKETFELSQLKNKAHEIGLKCDDVKMSNLKKTIAGLEESQNKKMELQSSIIAKEDLIKINTGRIEQVTAQLNVIDKDLYKTTSDNIFTLQSEINKLSTENGRLEAENKTLRDRLTKHDERVKELAEIDSRVSKKQQDITEWEIIESAFSPKGIPAMELSLQAPIIDREANRLLSVYGTRYKVETITQDYDSKGKLSEKFKILVHDAKSTDVKNLPNISGGQGVWVTKALQEAISKVASERSGRTWLYSIMDEADGALDSEIIPVFYDMLDQALDGKRKLVSVTHSTEAKNCITSIKDITDFFVGYKGE
jgi:DNA repair exonuclease SbcCD ATPase subunit